MVCNRKWNFYTYLLCRWNKTHREMEHTWASRQWIRTMSRIMQNNYRAPSFIMFLWLYILGCFIPWQTSFAFIKHLPCYKNVKCLLRHVQKFVLSLSFLSCNTLLVPVVQELPLSEVLQVLGPSQLTVSIQSDDPGHSFELLTSSVVYFVFASTEGGAWESAIRLALMPLQSTTPVPAGLTRVHTRKSFILIYSRSFYILLYY